MAPIIVLTTFLGIALVISAPFLCIMALAWLGHRPSGAQRLSDEEQAELTRLCALLDQMDRRLGNLEEILTDRERGGVK